MPKTKISEFSATPGNNTDIDGINLAEGCAPSGINDAIRELMSQLKDFQAGTAGDSFNGPVGTTTAAAGAFTTLSASSTVSGAGFSTYLASPPAIGGTAAAAGSFTTLSASSSVTLSGGTANGVAYLNGSKVLTTGSALTFDGTNLSTGSGSFLANGTTGITSFRATTTSNYAELQSRPDISYSRLLSSAYLLDIATLANQPILFTVNSSEQMRLTSTGLGIGTSSPSAGLHINKAFGSQFRIQEAGGTYFDIAAGGRFDLKNAAGTTIVSIAQSGSPVGTQLNLDSSGNLGLGVTPSAWTSGGRALDVSSAGTFAFTGGLGTIVAYNAFHNGTNWIYKASTGAKAFVQDSVNQYWLTAGNGTAGNAISFTQAMTLDASGRLLIGSTSSFSSAAKLQVQDAIALETNGTGGKLEFFSYGVSRGQITLPATAGQVDIAATSILSFATSSTERARIDANGTLLVGATTRSASVTSATKFQATATGQDYAAFFEGTNATVPYGVYIRYPNAAPNGTGSSFIFCEDNAAQRFSVRSNGGVYNYQANDVNLSDRREKTNFAPAKDYLDTICAIPVQTYNYIDQAEDDPGLTLGVVAQDVQAVAPELVTESNWGTEDNPKMRLSIYQTDLQYALMKCIQELKAQNDDLRARVAALESRT